MEPLRIEAQRQGDHIETIVIDAETLFDEATNRLSTHDFAGAIARYDRLLKDFATSRYAGPSLYNVGLAYEGLAQWHTAAQRYHALIAQYPETADAKDAQFRLGGCYAELRDFARSAEVFAHVAARSDLGLSDRIEARTRLGYARMKLHDGENARTALREAIADHQKNDWTERLDSPFFLAMAHYVLAEIAHEHFRAAPIRLPEQQMALDIDEKARLLLDSHNAYIETIKVRDPTWAAASGVQLGLLYREFHDALLSAPIPPELDEEARQIYRELLRKNDKMRSLLEKALSVYEKTLLMAERLGLRTDWVARAKSEIESVRALLRGGEDSTVPLWPEVPQKDTETPPASFIL